MQLIGFYKKAGLKEFIKVFKIYIGNGWIPNLVTSYLTCKMMEPWVKFIQGYPFVRNVIYSHLVKVKI